MPTFADFLDTVSTDNEFQTRLNQAKDAYRKQYGQEMPITSGTRSRAEQERLFRERSSNPNVVAAPGTSKHETGEAADIPASVPEAFLNQFGIHRPMGAKDPVHAVLMPAKQKPTESKSFADWIDTLPAEGKAAPAETERSTSAQVAAILAKALNIPKEVRAFTASALDTLAAVPNFPGYAAGRAFGLSPEEASAAAAKVPQAFAQPIGRLTGLAGTPEYQQALPTKLQEVVGQKFGQATKAISEKTGVPEQDVAAAMEAGLMVGGPLAAKGVKKGVVEPFKKAAAELEPPKGAAGAPLGSVGAAAVPNEAVIQQALSVVSPELKSQLQNIPVNKVNIPTLQRHIEADTLPVPVRLTEGQATGDVVKLSKEQNRRGQDPALAQRFNEQNGQLIENLDAFRERAAPDAYGARTMDHGQSLIDSYKSIDTKLKTDIDAKYQALRDAAGGQFPVDAPALLKNVETSLKKQLLSNDAPPTQLKELQRLASENAMTFEDFLSLRRNLGQVARTATDGNVRTAASIMVKELEKLPLQAGAKELKPLADTARKAARDRFQMLERDPAYRAAIDDAVPAEKFVEKFVINGHNKNVQTMVSHLDDVSRQHMAAGTLNYLRDRAGIRDGQGNFSQAGYNKALKFLDDSNKLPLIFDGDTATGLKTLGNVARYTQAQPKGSFVNNSNTLVGALAERAGQTVGKAAEVGLNVAAPGLQLGSALMEARAKRAARKETEKALKPGAGIENE